MRAQIPSRSLLKNATYHLLDAYASFPTDSGRARASPCPPRRRKTAVNQLIERLSEKGALTVHMLKLLLRQSRGSLGFLKLNLTQLTFDDFLRLPHLVDFDCTNVDHVTNALWEKLTPSRTSLRSLAAIGLNNLEFQFERIAEFSNLSSLNLSNTCVSVNDVIVICRTLAKPLTMLNVSEGSRLNLLAILPAILPDKETRSFIGPRPFSCRGCDR